MKSLIILSLVASSYAACGNITFTDGRMSSGMCRDESTGMAFEYIDMDGAVHKSLDEDDPDLAAAAMYSLYTQGQSTRTPVTATSWLDIMLNPDATSPRRLGVSHYWNACESVAVSGACIANYATPWTKRINAYGQGLKGIFSWVNRAGRLGVAPQAICSNYAGAGTLCVSWTVDNDAKLSGKQVSAITERCTNTCQAQWSSCVARVQGDSDRWVCVGDRAIKCGPAEYIYPC